jgi:glutathione peroxidase-family protein
MIYDLKVKDRNGNIVKRYSPTYNPLDMEKDIKELL